MLRWFAADPSGHYAQEILSAKAADSYDLSLASYNYVKVYPVAVFVGNYANDNIITITLGDGRKVTVPPRSNNIIPLTDNKVSITNSGRGECRLYFVDGGVSKEGLDTMAYDASIGNENDYLLHFENALTNSGSEPNGAITLNGAVVSTVPKFGTQGVRCFNDGDRLSITNAGFFTTATDFTFDAHVYISSDPCPAGTYIFSFNTNFMSNPLCGITSEAYNGGQNKWGFALRENGLILSSEPFAIVANNYSHVAWVHRSGVSNVFVNGVKILSHAMSNVTYAAANVGDINTTPHARDLRFDELRFLKGRAVWEDTFTQPLTPYL